MSHTILESRLTTLVPCFLVACSGSSEGPGHREALHGSGNAEVLVYIGTYSTGGSEGIYIFRLRSEDGALEPVGTAQDLLNPAFLAIHPKGEYLYAVNEMEDWDGTPGGAVAAYRIDPASGGLTLLNRKPSGGKGPCHLNVDPAGRFVLLANYGGGSVAVLPIMSDGSLGDRTSFIQHEGSSVNPSRQNEPHAHSIDVDAENQRVYVSDLGLDKVLIYRWDSIQGILTPNSPPFFSSRGGAGPRHFAFHPLGRFAYVINEIDSTITALSREPESGALTETQTVSTLPEDYDGSNSTAEIEVHPSGRFVYGSNRGHDSIAVFRVDPSSGQLSLVEIESTRGNEPRSFAIDPSGTFLLAANQRSNTVVTFRIDPDSGGLEDTGLSVSVPAPVCVKYLSR